MLERRALTPDRWREVKLLLDAALELPAGPARAACLERAGASDPELRREVESLLRQPTSRLEGCVEQTIAARAQVLGAAPATPPRCGAYVLQREVGRGGMGTVWLAAADAGQRAGLPVAVKLLRRGTDTDEVLRRFRAEQQILSRLFHPNIARLLDGGETDEGLPYLVMEYVDGTRVTDFVRGRPLIERLALFGKICAAVEFAHQHLIVHRDLKPGNILVTAGAEPKLLDFGIAKLLDPATAAEATVTGERRLTPAYASPEQARGAVITTVSDVYSLGAVLYELLTGRGPHRFRATSPWSEEMARVIQEVAPTRPSLATSDVEMSRDLRGDLDTVVLRALAKDPAQRYQSVRALAEDVRRYLAGLPVQARPDTLPYRAQKFVLRHRWGVTAAALVFLALAGGGITTAWQGQRAERRFQDVRRLAKTFLFEIHDAITVLPGSTTARKLVVSRSIEYLDDLAREARGDRDLQLELAAAYLRVGDVQGKPYSANLGDSAGALQSYAKAIELVAPFATREADWREVSARLLLCQILASRGEVEVRLGRGDAAARTLGGALLISQRALAEDAIHREHWRALVAGGLIGLGDAVQAANPRPDDAERYRRALAHYREALPLCEQLAAERLSGSADLRRLNRVCSRLATVLTQLGRKSGETPFFHEAQIFHDRSIGMSERSLLAEPENALFQRTLADQLIARASAKVDAQEDWTGALVDCQRALAMFSPLAHADPSNVEAQQDLSSAHYITSAVWKGSGQVAEAVRELRECLRLLEPLVAAQPDNAETTFDLARARRELAELTPPAEAQRLLPSP